jgi:hypothetical protein
MKLKPTIVAAALVVGLALPALAQDSEGPVYLLANLHVSDLDGYLSDYGFPVMPMLLGAGGEVLVATPQGHRSGGRLHVELERCRAFPQPGGSGRLVHIAGIPGHDPRPTGPYRYGDLYAGHRTALRDAGAVTSGCHDPRSRAPGSEAWRAAPQAAIESRDKLAATPATPPYDPVDKPTTLIPTQTKRGTPTGAPPNPTPRSPPPGRPLSGNEPRVLLRALGEVRLEGRQRPVMAVLPAHPGAALFARQRQQPLQRFEDLHLRPARCPEPRRCGVRAARCGSGRP